MKEKDLRDLGIKIKPDENFYTRLENSLLTKNISKKRYSFKRTALLAACLALVITVITASIILALDTKPTVPVFIPADSTQNSVGILSGSESRNESAVNSTIAESKPDESTTNSSSPNSDPAVGGPSGYLKSKMVISEAYNLPINPFKDEKTLREYEKNDISKDESIPVIYRYIKYFNISRETLIEAIENAGNDYGIDLSVLYNVDVLYSGDLKLIQFYYTDLSVPICYHNIKYHTINFIEYTEKDFTEWYKTLNSIEDFNIVNFVNYLKLPKEKFIEMAKKANVDIDADVVYSNDKKRIYEYFKDPDMDCPEYRYDYYVIPQELIEYVGYGTLPDGYTDSSKTTIEKNMARVNWMMKYKDDPDGINIVNFVRDHNIPKDKFIELTKDCYINNYKVKNYSDVAEIIYSNDKSVIDNYYKIY